MAALAAGHGITILEVVPTLATEYLTAFAAVAKRGGLARLTRFLTGGEALSPSLTSGIADAIPSLCKSSSCGIFNTYGPTEVTVQVVTGQCEPPFKRVPLGRPDHNVHSYVVVQDESRASSLSAAEGCWRLAEIDEPGELWLSGPRLARGYIGRPDVTAAAFVPNPFFAPATEGLPEQLKRYYTRAYRTGDLVRWAPDGQLEFLGRIDQQVKAMSTLSPLNFEFTLKASPKLQVKVNGVRIEIGDVEAVVAAAPGRRRTESTEEKHTLDCAIPHRCQARCSQGVEGRFRTLPSCSLRHPLGRLCRRRLLSLPDQPTSCHDASGRAASACPAAPAEWEDRHKVAPGA